METCSWLVSLVSWLVNQAVTCFGRSGEEFSLSDSPPQFASLVHITAPCWATDPSTLPGVRHDATRARHYTLTTLMNNFNPSGIIIQRERQQSRRWHWLTIVSWNKVDLISFPTGNSLWRPNEAESGENHEVSLREENTVWRIWIRNRVVMFHLRRGTEPRQSKTWWNTQ